MKPRLLTANKFIYALLVFYLLAKDPFYQLQAILFQDVVLKMAYVKLFLLLTTILIIPFFFGRMRLTGLNWLLLLFVVYNFCTITLINNDFPLQDRLTIFYITMFLPLLVLVMNLFGIEPGRFSRRTKRFAFSTYILFTLLDCLVGLWQQMRGADFYAPFYSVSLLGITPSKVLTVNQQTRSFGLFLDGVQHGLFLIFSLFFFLSLLVHRQKYRYLIFLPLLLANLYFTYTRSIYVFAGLNLALMTLLASMRWDRTLVKRILLRNFWLVSMLCGAFIYVYGITMGESDVTRSLFIRYESARFILEKLTVSLDKLLFCIGYIQNSELFGDFVPDNLFLAFLSSGGVIALLIFLAIFFDLNRKITGNLDPMYGQPAYLAAYLLFVNIFAFGMFCNYLDSVFIFLLVPILYLLHNGKEVPDSEALRAGRLQPEGNRVK